VPLYEFGCAACDHVFDALVTKATGEPTACPACGKAEVRRLIGLPAQGRVKDAAPATNCRGDGPPCGAPRCGRQG
jgi:putative FmdB family regulatory protein